MSLTFEAPPQTPTEAFGFPPATPVVEMTDAERAEYWRHEAKKQQRKYADAMRELRRLLVDLSSS